MLSVVWAWVGWAWHWDRYAQVNWAAEYLAAGFGVQAVLLLLEAGGMAKQRDARCGGSRVRAIGMTLAVAGLVAYPLLAIAQGRPWQQAEVFGLMPEPTALVTLGLLLAAGHGRWLTIVPILSLAVGVATWWMLRSVSA